MMSPLGLLLLAAPAHASHFSWYQLVPGFSEEGEAGKAMMLNQPGEAYVALTMWAIVIVMLGAALVARGALNRAVAQGGTAAFVPDNRLSIRNIFEIIIEWQYELISGMVGKHEAKAFFPLIGTLFLYVLACNLSGFIPGHLPPTDNFSHNLALAICVFLVFNYAGLSRQGFGYIKHLAGPVALLAPAFFILETISLLVRPVSLTVRLGVNISVDHLLQTIARDLGGSFFGVVGSALLPVPLYFLGLLVCVVQAFVFALLTTIYVSLSVAHADEHHH